MRMPLARSSGDLLADRRYAYATEMLAEGDIAAAADLLRQTLDLVPHWAPAWMLLGAAEERQGLLAVAAEAFARAVTLDPAGALGANLHVARLRGGPPPDGMAQAYVAALFDGYAPRFDHHLRDRLGYRGPALIGDALSRVCGTRSFARALDLGCGTGLMGVAIRNRVGRLDGVDLSAAMVAEAARKDVYDALDVDDIVGHLGTARAGAFDLILAADVFVYFGALGPVFAAAARALAPGGLLAFTTQTHEGSEARLGADLRFSHPAAVVHDTLAEAALRVVDLRAASTRRESGTDVPGLLVVARAAPEAT